ncbi:MAG: phosphate ABC transporter permease PstA [Planctomycetota bacterium]|nr:phosphate ABC transporter permease PstA [Planctomycetota bacterium]
MNIPLRQAADKLFTWLGLLSVALIVAALLGILLPMLWQGGGAVLFRGTVEFRKLQLDQFGRGDSAALRGEIDASAALRQQAYQILDAFAAGLDTSEFQTQVRQLHREFGSQIAHRDLPADQTADLKALSKELRDDLLEAFQAPTKEQALACLDKVLRHVEDDALKGTVAFTYFDLERRYRKTLATVFLSQRGEYAESLQQVKESLRGLLGPRPGERLPPVMMDQYGATRWDNALHHLDRLLWAESWTAPAEGQTLTRTRIPRETQFAGTPLARLFPFVRDNIHAMLRPQWTFYWQYVIDDGSSSGHYFGGVGPEILGTLLITVLTILFALPVGVIAAAYLVECAGDSFATRSLRMFVNTLAGVPSIVFGLFGMAFFVIYLLPKFGFKGSSILAGSLTLALLVLPVIIRASEEAIRAVPRAYKEAALALGASRFRCFLSVTLPAAMPGVLTGLILSMSRAAGETAPILFTAGVAMGAVPTSLAQPTRTLSYSSHDMAVGDKMAMLAPHNQFGMVMTLVGIVLVLNVAAIVLRARMSRALRGQ